ncbi:MAG: hypothetical protein JRN20_22565, partial [Nitrososphaerota archaeon]|nr:hypothetical protein [Nitrososphaerota archaeon]
KLTLFVKFRKLSDSSNLRANSNRTGSASTSEDSFDEMEPKIRQQIRIVGRTIFCFRCEGSKEMASYYCACGSFLCIMHLAEHSCLVSASMQYNDELLQALS